VVGIRTKTRILNTHELFVAIMSFSQLFRFRLLVSGDDTCFVFASMRFERECSFWFVQVFDVFQAQTNKQKSAKIGT